MLDIPNYISNRVEALDNLPENSIKKSFNPSWVEGMDIRTETDEFNFNRQRYLFRISPSTPKIRTAQTNLHQSYLEKASLQHSLLRKDFVEMAYEEVLFFYEAVRKLALMEELLIVFQDQEKVWGKLSQTSLDIPKDWLNVQEDIAELEIDIFKVRNILVSWQFADRSINWDNLITINGILTILEESREDVFQLQSRKFDVENLIIQRETELEQAEQKKILDFVQVEYSGPHEDLLEERMSLTAAFSLPFSSSRKLKIEEMAIEKEMLQQELAVEKQVNAYKKKKLRDKLQLLVEAHNFSEKLYAEQSEKMLTMVQKSTAFRGGNPLFALQQKGTEIEKKLELLKLEMAIYGEYLEYLILTEQLFTTSDYSLLSKLPKN